MPAKSTHSHTHLARSPQLDPGTDLVEACPLARVDPSIAIAKVHVINSLFYAKLVCCIFMIG